MLGVQRASPMVFHCYAIGQHFTSDAPGLLSSLPDLSEAYLVTAGRKTQDWCLVLKLRVPAVAAHLEDLRRILADVRSRVGLGGGLLLLQPLDRKGSNGRTPAADEVDWLTP